MAASKLRSITATTSYVSLPDLDCSAVSILNSTGATLSIEMAGDSAANQEIVIPTGSSVVISVANSAKEINIKSASGTTGVYIVTQ